MTIKARSRIIVFILAFLVWIGLTSITDLQEVVAGIIVAFLVAMLAGKFFITAASGGQFPRRFFSGILYVFKFLWEMIKANFHVAYIVISPHLPIKPGIVKIKTRLKSEPAITVLTNSITLTPGTLTVDVNPEKGDVYIHWIDVKGTDVEENTRNIGSKFEKLLKEVFE